MNEELRDIKPIADIPVDLFPYFVLTAIVVALLLIALWIWKKRKAKPRPQKVVPARDYREVIAERLEKLKGRDTTDKAFHFEFSEVVREFLERRFDFSATDMTLEQVLEVTRKKLSAQHFAKFEKILGTSDAVKFANAKITPQQGSEHFGTFVALFAELKIEPEVKVP